MLYPADFLSALCAYLLESMRKVLQKLIDSIKYALKGSSGKKYPETYTEEMEYQCARIMPMIALFSCFAWLPYYFIDSLGYPSNTLMPIIRLGLSPLGVIVFILTKFKPTKYWNLILMHINGMYVLLGAAALAILSNGDPAYIGGFYIAVLFCTLIGPIPFQILAIDCTIIFGFFIGGLLIQKVNLSSTSQQYSMRDFGTVVMMSYFFGYIQHRIRRTNYLRAKEIERQRSESNRLLLNILPETIAEELKLSGSTRPIRFEGATVMFTDFVGFTRISEKLSPEDVVAELDKCFSYFDNVAQKYGLEKLKTIGDAYMAAGGIPVENNTHPIDCALAALEIQSFMNQMKEIKEQHGFPYWELRLGMHTGPLVAGVVGEKKFAYDVWGDTVNTASRMESSGEPGAINISRELYDRLRFLFACEYRGKV